MNRIELMLLVAVTLTIGTTPGYAETTVTTTTVEKVTGTPEFFLSADASYVAVNPSGTLLGLYDYKTRLINGSPLPLGAFVIEKTSGKVLATVDANGNLIAFTTVPQVLPQHFIIRNGALFFLGSDYSLRRAQLEAQINADYAAGHLSSTNVKELQQKLQEIQVLETKDRGDGTYKSSTVRQIERKFARVQSDYARNVADINQKRARIGLNNS